MTDDPRLAPVRELLDAQVAEGRVPGYVAAVRAGGTTTVLAGGSTAVAGGGPMTAGTQFRIASVTKLVAGALTLALAEDGVLALDDEVARWLPELAAPRVLADPAGPLAETVPAARPITVRHLLTHTAGLGLVPEAGPLQQEMFARGLAPSAFPPAVGPDEYLRGTAALPLAGQPGETWNYSSDVLSVLLARAAGRSVGELVAERVTGPLGSTATGFTGDPARLATLYAPAEGGLTEADPPDGVFARPPAFESLAAGLVSTAPDVLAFLCALADGGGPLLPAGAVAAMTADALTPQLRGRAEHIVGPGRSWGLMTAVEVEPTTPWRTPGRWGWDGGTGTSAWVDPARDLVAVLLTQRLTAGPHDGPDRFWAALAGCVPVPA
jgi:CubicO group peptidase (beta-lactamase class C family)